MSSGVNALAASVVEDYVKKWRPGLPDSKLALISKGISVISGVIAFGFVFIAESMGNIFSAVSNYESTPLILDSCADQLNCSMWRIRIEILCLI